MNTLSVIGPREGTKRARKASLPYGGGCRSLLLILLVCVSSACSASSQAPVYTGADISLPATNVGAGDIHALDGNLMW